MNRRSLFWTAACFVLLLNLPAFAGGEKEGAATAKAQPAYRFALLCYDSAGNPYWQKVIRGMKDAGIALGVSVEYQFAENDPAKVNNLVETAITNKVDGIGLVLNLDDYDQAVRKALAAGIPVVGFNQDDSKGSAGNPRMAFIGQDFIDAGYTIGKAIVQKYNIKKGDTFVCPVEHPAAIYASRRFAGVAKAFQEVGATGELLDSGVQSAEDSMNKQIQYLLGHPEVDAVVALGQLGCEVAPQAIKEAGLSIPCGGFDLSEKILKNILEGKMYGTIDQQPYFQGSLTVYFLWAYKKYALWPCNVNTGSALITKDNAQAVLGLVETVR